MKKGITSQKNLGRGDAQSYNDNATEAASTLALKSFFSGELGPLGQLAAFHYMVAILAEVACERKY